MSTIDRFEGEHRFLSNFYEGAAPVVYRGTWRTAEHAYQAAKSYDPAHVQRVLACRSPGQAKRAGREAVLVPHWDTTKVLVMWQVLVAKFGGQTDKVTLHGKVHHASPNRWVRNGANERVSHPLCGQRSRRFYPSYLVSNDEHPVTCEKCRAIAEA